jgi:N-acetylmuramoyl-L-alanine amidase
VIRSTLASEFLPSPNVEPRQNDFNPDMLILHYTGMDNTMAACRWLCDPVSKVSCHYLIDERGAIIQMVDEGLRAWHAGVSSWKGAEDINSCSIGIEIQNPGHTAGYPDFPEAQMLAVIALCKDIIARHAIYPTRVLGHSDIAPMRKIDPGEKFDWARLHAEGIGHWVKPEPIGGGTFLQLGDQGQAVEALQGMLRLYGYATEISGKYDGLTQATVRAFQRHFRPSRVDGIADSSTVITLHRLLNALDQA